VTRRKLLTDGSARKEEGRPRQRKNGRRLLDGREIPADEEGEFHPRLSSGSRSPDVPARCGERSSERMEDEQAARASASIAGTEERFKMPTLAS